MQDQADAPGGEQGFKWPPIKKTDHAALNRHPRKAGNDEGQWHRRDERVSQHVRCIIAAQLLHHICRIGAYHNHFAMRHVDHAHHTEGNGKSDRREQQDRAERDTLENIFDKAQHGETFFHLVESLPYFGSKVLIFGGWIFSCRQPIQLGAEHGSDFRIGLFAKDNESVGLNIRRFPMGKVESRERPTHDGRHFLVRFHRKRLRERRDHLGRPAFEDRIRGIYSERGILVQER